MLIADGGFRQGRKTKFIDSYHRMYEAKNAEYIRIYESIVIEFCFDLK